MTAKVFVPFTEALSIQMIDALGLSSTDLVPFQLDYQCVPVDLGEHEDPEREAPAEVDNGLAWSL